MPTIGPGITIGAGVTVAALPDMVTSGLALYLDAGQPTSYSGTGTSWYDLSKSGLTATLVNSPTFVSAGSASYFSFNGTNNTASIPYTTVLDPTAGLTIECWVYPTDITTNRYYELYRKDVGTGRQLFSFQEFGTVLSFGTHTTVNGYSELDINITAGDYTNQWLHLVASYSSGSKVIYRNSVSIGSTAAITGTLVQGTADFYIGSLGGAGENFKGRYAMCNIYNVGLSAADVLKNYNNFKGRYGL